MTEGIYITQRVDQLKQKAAVRYKISSEKCHVGHIVLEAMLEYPDMIHQIDAVTGESETHNSVATRSQRLANAMTNFGLKVGDHVVIIGHNHLDLCIPYFACHYNGHAMCAIDPSITAADLQTLFKYVHPKMVFCPNIKAKDVTDALQKNNHTNGHVVMFDYKTNEIEAFIRSNNGTEENFKPAEFDHATTTCWLMLTSGTTGLPKVAVIPYETLLNGLCSWWKDFTEKWDITLAMATIQWMSSLIFFISSPLMKNARLQTSIPITPQLLIALINKYKPNVCAWTPYLLGQFLNAAGNYCDLSCFKYIAVGGSAIEKPLLDAFQKKCGAYLYLVYGMTELLVPVFEFNQDTPFGSTGKPYQKFEYKLVGENGKIMAKPNQTGELWIKGNEFFRGYLNNPEETSKLLTDDGWIKTGDIFYRDEQNYYYFVERKRLLIKYTGFWISPLQLEAIIKQHPGVAEACVVGIPDKETTETPVAVIQKRNGNKVEPQEIFDLVRMAMPDVKQLHGGLYFLDSLPTTPSGKIHRAKLRNMTLTASRIMPN